MPSTSLPSGRSVVERPSAAVIATLLSASSLTVMAGASIAPSLPTMSGYYAKHPELVPAGGDPEFLARLALTGPGLFTALGALLVGPLVDRVGRLWPLVIGLVLYVAAGTSGLYVESLGQLLVGRALLGAAVALVMVSTTALIGDMFVGPDRQRFAGLQGACMSFGGVIFLVCAGFLADIGWRWPFAIYFAALLVLIGAGTSLARRVRTNRAAMGHVPASADGNARVPIGSVALVLALAFLSMVLFYMIPTHLPYRLQEIGVGERKFGGIAIAVNGLVAGIVSMNYNRVKAKLPFAGVSAVQMGVMGLGYFAISQATSYPLVLASCAMTGLGQGLMLPNLTNWIQSIAPMHLRGRLTGAVISAVFFGQFFSPIITKPIGDRVGLAGEFMIAAAFMGGLCVFFGVFAAMSRRGRA
jgi:MFS family permease